MRGVGGGGREEGGEWVLYRTCLTHKCDYKKTTRTTTSNKTNTSAIAAKDSDRAGVYKDVCVCVCVCINMRASKGRWRQEELRNVHVYFF